MKCQALLRAMQSHLIPYSTLGSRTAIIYVSFTDEEMEEDRHVRHRTEFPDLLGQGFIITPLSEGALFLITLLRNFDTTERLCICIRTVCMSVLYIEKQYNHPLPYQESVFACIENV